MSNIYEIRLIINRDENGYSARWMAPDSQEYSREPTIDDLVDLMQKACDVTYHDTIDQIKYHTCRMFASLSCNPVCCSKPR